MKKLIILLLASAFAITANAQTDTAKKVAKAPAPKTRMIGGTMMSSANNIVTNLSKSNKHTVFVSMLTASGLTGVLQSGTYTVLAPTDDAFKKLPAGTVDTLLTPAHLADLTKQVNGYIIQGKLTSGDIAKKIKAGNGQATIATLSGSMLTARINPDRNIVLTDDSGNQAVIAQFDVAQSNGLVDVIVAPLSVKAN